MEYTNSLALVDFLPVIFSALGVVIIAQMIARLDQTSGYVAYSAAVLIILGGLSKAVWKLVIAATGQDLVGLDDMLFVFLGPGFTLLSWALSNAQRVMAGKEIPQNIWLRPLGVIALFGVGAIAARIFQPEVRYWVYILLTLTTFANLALGVLLIKQSIQMNLTWAVALFVFNLIAIFALSGMARIPEQTIALQWLEECINVLAQGAFAVAAWQLNKKTAVFTSSQPSERYA